MTTLGLPATDTAATGAPTACVEVGGNRLNEQPEETLALSPTYRSGNIGNTDWSWVGRIDLRWSGDEYVDVQNIMSLPASTTTTVRWPSGTKTGLFGYTVTT